MVLNEPRRCPEQPLRSGGHTGPHLSGPDGELLRFIPTIPWVIRPMGGESKSSGGVHFVQHHADEISILRLIVPCSALMLSSPLSAIAQTASRVQDLDEHGQGC